MSVVGASLEDMAAARERGRRLLDDANAEVARLKAPLDAAVERRSELKRQLDYLDAAMETAKREHLIHRAVAELGIETEEPVVVLAKQWSGERAPRRYELVALTPDGKIGLYCYRPPRSHRYLGKTWAIRAEHVPEGIERVPGRDRQTDRNEEKAGLAAWETRGRGDYGDGSGSPKNRPAPDGSRWRWLKVGDQEELTA
jgi:hypothetical protein